jgi:hypothetical protein
VLLLLVVVVVVLLLLLLRDWLAVQAGLPAGKEPCRCNYTESYAMRSAAECLNMCLSAAACPCNIG